MAALMTASTELIDVLEKTLARSSEPLPPGKIAKQLTGPFRTPRQTVADILADMAAQGRVHEFAPYRTKEKRYWTRDVNDYVRETLLKLLSTKSLTRSELRDKYKNLLKGVSDGRVTSIFNELLAGNKIQKLPSHIGTRTDRFSTRPLDVAEYTDYAIKKLAEKLGKHGVTQAQIVAAVAATGSETPPVEVAQSGLTAPALPAPDQPQRERETPAADTASVRDQILDRLREDLELNNRPLAKVADIRRLFDFQDLSKGEFDEAVLELRRQQVIELDRHDHPESLSPEQRNELVSDGNGNFFNTISFRNTALITADPFRRRG
jgi:hypothetical protein